MPLEDAKVGIEDIGLLRGYGIYDGLAAFNGRPFRFADHWQRFTDGAHALGLNIPITEDSCEKKIVMELPIFGWLALLQSRKYAESNAKLFSAAGVAKLLECN